MTILRRSTFISEDMYFQHSSLEYCTYVSLLFLCSVYVNYRVLFVPFTENQQQQQQHEMTKFHEQLVASHCEATLTPLIYLVHAKYKKHVYFQYCMLTRLGQEHF